MMFRVISDILDVVYSLGQRTAIERLAVFLLYLRHWRRLTDGLADDTDPALVRSRSMSREDIADFRDSRRRLSAGVSGELEERGLIRRLDTHRMEWTTSRPCASWPASGISASRGA